MRSTKNSPDSWCKKSESKGAEVPPADFLLEAEKRGSPPKSEKRQLLARRGSGAGGAALLRKESELSGENSVRVVESKKELCKTPKTKFLLLCAFAKRRNPSNHKTQIRQARQIAESTQI